MELTDGARRVNVHTIRNIRVRGGGRPSLAKKPHLSLRAPRVARAPPPVDDVRFSVSLDTDIDIPHMRTPPARIAAAAPAT